MPRSEHLEAAVEHFNRATRLLDLQDPRWKGPALDCINNLIAAVQRLETKEQNRGR